MKSDKASVREEGEGKIGSILLDMVTRFYEGIFTESAEEQVPKILGEAARVFEADIATWFLVTEDRSQLRLVDVYNDLGKTTARPPAEPYYLNWDAKSKAEVDGLTAWVAISGEQLHVPSVESLTVEHQKTHAGRWDDWLYPQGIRDETSGFLCMYAVPLVLPTPGPTKHNVVGVLKMERRNMKGDKKRQRFSQSDRDSFNVIARIMGFAYFHSERQKSLTLADLGHALIRPLGDVSASLEGILLELDPADNALAHPRSNVEYANKMLRSLVSLLSLAKDSYNEPLQSHTDDIRKVLQAHMEAYSLTSGRSVVDKSSGTVGNVTLTIRSFAALVNVAVNLIDNATRNSLMNSQVTVEIERLKPAPDEPEALLLRVVNPGEAIPEAIIREAASSDYAQRFRGLPRSFQLAVKNGWNLEYKRVDDCNCFELKVPL